MPAKTNATPEPGKKAPAFHLEASDGKKYRLSSFTGRYVVLYFYPKDMTPGCTTEAQGFRDNAKEFGKQDAVILGVSPDSAETHRKFIEKEKLPFLLVADPDHTAAEKYGVWVEKNMYGRKYWGVQRATFLIGPDGKIVRSWPKVSPKAHAQEVLAALKEARK